MNIDISSLKDMAAISDVHLGVPGAIPDKEIQKRHDVYADEFICHLRKTPSVLYGMFVEMVRQLYMMPSDGFIKGTPDVHWSGDAGKSGIWIDTELNWNDEHPEFRPAIYVKLGQIEYSDMNGIFGIAGMSLESGTYHYATKGAGTVTFVHVGETSGSACILCDNTQEYLNAFSDPIKRDYCFTELKLAGRVPLQQSQKESKERYVSAVTFRYSFDQTFSINREAPILKNFRINIGQEPPMPGIINAEVRRPTI